MAGLAAAAGDTCVLRSRGDLAIAVCIPAPTACVFTRSTSSRRFLSSRLPFSGTVVRCALASFPCARAISPRLLYGIVSADEDSGAPAHSESRTAPAPTSGAVRDSLWAGAPESSSAETIPYKSLGEIARAHGNDASAQRTTVPEKGNLEERKRREEVERVKTQAVGAGMQTAIAKSPLDRRT